MDFAIKQHNSYNYSVNTQNTVNNVSENKNIQAADNTNNSVNTQERISEAATLLNHFKKFGLKNNLTGLFTSFITNFSLNDDRSLKDISQIDIESNLDEIAKSYVYLQKYIQADDSLTKEDKEQMMANLDLAFNQGLNDFASNYALSSDSFLQEYGINNSGSDIIDSIHNIVNEKITSFNDYLQSEEGIDYSNKNNINFKEINFDDFVKELDKGYKQYLEDLAKNPKKTDDNADVQVTTEQTKENKEDNLYTLNNLASMYQIAKANKGFNSSNINSSEEEIAFNAATQAIATLDILKQKGASKEFTELLSDGLYNKLQNNITSFNKNLKAKQDMVAQYSSASASHYQELDSSRINSLYRQMVNTYSKSSDAVQSVITSFEIAKTSFANNYDSSLTRYSNGQDFFNNFYEVDKTEGYNNRMSLFKSICNNFKAINININC